MYVLWLTNEFSDVKLFTGKYMVVKFGNYLFPSKIAPDKIVIAYVHRWFMRRLYDAPAYFISQKNYHNHITKNIFNLIAHIFIIIPTIVLNDSWRNWVESAIFCISSLAQWLTCMRKKNMVDEATLYFEHRCKSLILQIILIAPCAQMKWKN